MIKSDCFHSLTIINDTMNIGLQISIGVSVLFLLDKYPEVEKLWVSSSLLFVCHHAGVGFMVKLGSIISYLL